MKKNLKFFLPYRIIMAVFYFVVLLTMFMPMFSLDEYVEYQFHDASYADEYKSYSTPLAHKITPFQLITNLWSDETDALIYKTDYLLYEKECQNLYSSGKITNEEYQELLANGKQTGQYYVTTIYQGTADYARIQDKVKLISIITAVLYGLACIFFIFNVFNIAFNAKFLYITNTQGSWIYAVGTLGFILYVFATSLTNYTYHGTNNDVVETTMTCMSVNTIFLLLLFLEALYALFSAFVSIKFSKECDKIEEVPDFITYKVQNTPKPQPHHKTNRIPVEILNKNNKNSGTSKKKKRKKNGKK